MAKETTIVQIYGTFADVGDANASIDIPADGFLIWSQLNVTSVTFDAAADGGRFELAFGSTSKFATNDARGVLGYMSVGMNGASIGRGDNSVVLDYGSPGIRVFGGERIYLHTVAIGAGAWIGSKALLGFMFKSGSARR